MATILLSAVGASVGAGFGGAVLGLSGAVIGRAAGATLGRVIDQRLLGAGSKPVETGRIDRLRIPTTGEGVPIARVWGQMRVPGHIIWATPLEELTEEQGGGKGTSPRITEYSYRISVAIALCEGPISGVGRVWADGEEIALSDLNIRVYDGSEDQLPDPAIKADKGDEAPAYRGIAYVVLEDLDLERWGNRLPQFGFEVTAPSRHCAGLSREIEAVAMIPGTGEYALATTPVSYDLGLGQRQAANRASVLHGTDFTASLDTLGRELPRVGSVSLVVSWFGDDLRAGQCRVRPKVEQVERDGAEMAWRAGGIDRAAAEVVAKVDGRPIYGGTPADESVVEALRAIAAQGRKAVFYPFILMEQLADNARPDPWSGAPDQPVMPWRGRITTEIAPGRDGSSQGTDAARAEVEGFFGTVEAGDFAISDGRVVYSGPDEWSYRRFILHYAWLCKLAGGIDSFLIGSEMRALTQIMGAAQSFPAVEQFIRLARDVRGILGAEVKLGYAADWSEYFGYQPGNGDVHFHLDPLWADAEIDFIGIDNYMPLSDWREGEDHLDAAWGSIYNTDYLMANIAGGEGYDWYYAAPEHRDAQIRTPISDGAYGEDWIWRYKDLRGWWSNPHHPRVNGARSPKPTAWVPGSKPIWFTEMGCAALDKGTNQPNKFLDAMSSESQLPHYSSGRRDDAIQAAYLRAMVRYWSDPAHNPRGAGGQPMVALDRAHVWAWDARPFPAFPGRVDLWSDGPAWARGHWLNGRAGAVHLADIVRDICVEAGISEPVCKGLWPMVRGYVLTGRESGRAALQPLMLAYGFDAIERDGALRFVMRDGRVDARLSADELAVSDEMSGPQIIRAAEPELAGRIRLSHIEAGADYAVATCEAVLPGDDSAAHAENEFNLVLDRGEGRAIVERWLAEARVARDMVRFVLPPSRGDLGPGDVVRLDLPGDEGRHWRIDRVERAGAITVDAVRSEQGVYLPADGTETSISAKRYDPPMPVWPVFLDLPLLTGSEAPHAPRLAVSATPWLGQVAAYSSIEAEGGYRLNTRIGRPAMIGRSLSALGRGRHGVIQRGSGVKVQFAHGQLRSVGMGALLAGANMAAIGDGSPENWEIFQFCRAVPEGEGVWILSELLRGQAGSDALMPDRWPEGAVVVILDSRAVQVDLPPEARGQLRHWRIGPALRGYDDPSYLALAESFEGVGLRPLSPCHLRLRGDVLSWTRRTRIGGDAWGQVDVPLSEASERYRVRIIQNGEIAVESDVSAPRFTLSQGVMDAARAQGRLHVAIAQISETFGPGPFSERIFDV